jgi:hypothetical protein
MVNLLPYVPPLTLFIFFCPIIEMTSYATKPIYDIRSNKSPSNIMCRAEMTCSDSFRYFFYGADHMIPLYCALVLYDV